MTLPLFWRVQIVGWLFFMLMSVPMKVVYYGSLPYALLLTALREPVGFLLTSGMRPLIEKLSLRADRPLRVSLWLFPLAFAAAGIDLLAAIGVGKIIGREDGADEMFGPYLFRALLFLLWILLYLGIKSILDTRERLLVLSRAETAARDAEILMLRAQVSPHFLFNAFNTILADLDGKNPGLVPVVRGLSDYFRYSLTSRHEVFVTMGEEYDAILSYLVVEKARFEDSLQVECEMENSLRDIAVPGIFLQPLVENALKYGHMTSPTPLRLRLRIFSLDEEMACVEVTNSGHWVDAPEPRPDKDPGGNGLSILRRRLELLYPDHHSLEIDSPAESGEVTVRIRLPLQDLPFQSHEP